MITQKVRINFVDGSNPYTVEMNRILRYKKDKTMTNDNSHQDCIEINDYEGSPPLTYTELVLYFINQNQPIIVAKQNRLKRSGELSGLIVSIERIINTSSIKSIEPILEE